jgi:hypothetical protein
MSVNRILANHTNVIKEAAIVASTQRPSTDIRLLSQSRQGGGLIALEGPYTGADDSTVDIEIIEGTGGVLRPSEPILNGVGSGDLTITALDMAAVPETLQFSLVDKGSPPIASRLAFFGSTLIARDPGFGSNALGVFVQRNLTFAPMPFATLHDIAAGSATLEGPEWDWGQPAGAAGEIPDTAIRVQFAGYPTIHRAWKTWEAGRYTYRLDPPPEFAIEANTRINAVEGDYTLTLSDGAHTETYTAVTVFEFLSAVRARSGLVEVLGAVAPDKSPGGMAVTDIPLRTDARALPARLEVSSRRAKRPDILDVSPSAPTENIVLEYISQDRWSVSGGVSGQMNEAKTDTEYLNGPVHFKIKRIEVPLGASVPASYKVRLEPREEGQGVPSVCLKPLKLGKRARTKQITFVYTQRPGTACACKDMAPLRVNDFFLGWSDVFMAIDDPAYLARIRSIYDWREGFVRGNTKGPVASRTVQEVIPGRPAQPPRPAVEGETVYDVEFTLARTTEASPTKYTLEVKGLGGSITPNFTNNPASFDVVFSGIETEQAAQQILLGVVSRTIPGTVITHNQSVTINGFTGKINIPQQTGNPSILYPAFPEGTTSFTTNSNGTVRSESWGSSGGSTVNVAKAKAINYPTLPEATQTGIDSIGFILNENSIQLNQSLLGGAVTVTQILSGGTIATGGPFVVTSYTVATRVVSASDPGSPGSPEVPEAVVDRIIPGRLQYGAEPRDIDFADQALNILMANLADIYNRGAAPNALWDALWVEVQADMEHLMGLWQSIGVMDTRYLDRYKAAADNILLEAGLLPKSSANAVGGDGSWRDLGHTHWWADEVGEYMPAFTNAPYHSCATCTGGQPDKTEGAIYSTAEFAFGLLVACPENLKEGDRFTVNIAGNAETGEYREGDRIIIPLVSAASAPFTGGSDGDATHTWTVRGSVSGSLPDWPWHPQTPMPYNDGPLSAELSAGGIPYEVGDVWRVAIEGGVLRWRRDEGAWHQAPLFAPHIDMGEGLFAHAFPGAAPSFVQGDTWVFRAIATHGVSRLRAPRVGQGFAFEGAACFLDVDLGAVQPLEAVMLALHTLPETAMVHISGGVFAIGEWSADPVCVPGPIIAMLPAGTQARYLRVAMSGVGAQGASIGWLWAGVAWQPTVGASTLDLVRRYGLTRNEGLNPSGLYRGKGTGGRIAWSRSDNAALEAPCAARLLALLDAATENGLEPLCVVPDMRTPTRAALAVVDADEIAFTEHTQWQGPEAQGRWVFVDLPLRAVLT